ncbi:MAG: hypothetical protein AAGI28_13245 [Pseudomonadota bacterium]
MEIIKTIFEKTDWPWPVAVSAILLSLGYLSAQLAKLIEAWRKNFD